VRRTSGISPGGEGGKDARAIGRFLGAVWGKEMTGSSSRVWDTEENGWGEKHRDSRVSIPLVVFHLIGLRRRLFFSLSGGVKI